MKKRNLFIVSSMLLMSILVSVLCSLPISAAGVTEISTAEQLKAVANNLNGDYKLVADIDLGGATWMPIGDNDNPFTGVFDGNGKTVSNFIITADETFGKKTAGFFGTVSSGTVKNLKIATATVTTTYSHYVGAIVGYLSDLETGLVSGCVTASDVTVTATGKHCDQLKLGGIVGFSSHTVEYCENNATVTTKDTHSLTNGTNKAYTGGIAGGAIGTVRYCINNGAVTTDDYDGKKSGWYTFSGGVLGQINPWSELTAVVVGCINNGTVTNSFSSLATNSAAGGILGNTYGGNSSITARTIENCFNFGAIDCINAGQIVGKMGNSEHLGAFSSSGNYCIKDLAPVCYDYDKPAVGACDTADNIKALDAYKALVSQIEEKLVFELSAMPAPAVPSTPPEVPGDGNTEDTGNTPPVDTDNVPVDTNDKDDKVTSAPETQPAQSTTDTAAAEEKGGCGSTVSIASVALIGAFGAAIAACKKKHD